MLRYVLKRLMYLVFVFFILSIILYGIFQMVPGDPAKMMVDPELAAKSPTRYEAAYQQAKKQLGLDKPIHERYAIWITNMLTGKFGYSSYYKKPVINVIQPVIFQTVRLNILNLILVFCITIPLGITTAVRKYTAYDNIVQVVTVVGVSMPMFILALVVIYFFAIKLPIFPISGVGTPGANFTGMAAILDYLKHVALPLMVMTISSLAGITRYVRGAMIEILRMDYIRTARAKGLREKAVIYSHAFRNALIPVVTIFTGWFISVFAGSIVIEGTFLLPGMGQLLISSLRQLDYAVVLTMNMFYILLALIGNLIMDLVYMLVDPRVKLS